MFVPFFSWSYMSVLQAYDKDLFLSGDAKPLFSDTPVTVAISAANADLLVASVPAGKAWLISSVGIVTPAGVTVARVTLDGVPTGQSLVASSTGNRVLKDWFGDFVPARKEVRVVASNSSTTAAADVRVILYGWEVTF